ncbi:MAG: glycosyltransferase [Proteobacteria bacterium]|nr:glycosyltransferase [Pseudomonadota bacterium]
MSGASAPAADALREAWARLKQGRPPAEAEPLAASIGPGDPLQGQAQHLRGACAERRGDHDRAKALLVDAIRLGEQGRVGVWSDLAAAVAGSGFADDAALAMLKGVIREVTPEGLFPLARGLLIATGFGTRDQLPWKDAAFETLAVPILARLLALDRIDAALALETLLYENYVKPRETEAHFTQVMARIEPLFTAAAHRLREALPPLPEPSLDPPHRVGFFIHNATMLAHIEVLLNTLKGYRMLEDQPFEPIVYCLGGKSPEMEAALAGLGVRLVMLNERFPDAGESTWRRLLGLRELLARDGVQELVWVSLVTLLPLAFGLRLAPVQTWWAMKYRHYSQPDIDGYVTGSALTRFSEIAGRRWRMARLGVDDWYDANQEPEACEIRAGLGDAVVLMTLARTEKMVEPPYLDAMVRILRARPRAVFLWAGREPEPAVVEAFRAGGVADRARYIGWVNTRLYAQVADIFLDTFPAPCGFTCFQAMAAGKPVVIYDSHEAAQTGLWNFMRPLVDGDEGAPGERAELRSIIGDAADPRVAIARSPDDYVRLALRLIDDPEARAEAGEASRRFIERYFSDPRDLGASMAEHFMELIALRREPAPG